MATTRYPLFFALARAAELVGERWTLMIVRELLLGPRRFTDLRARLNGVSPSVLTQRLGALEEADTRFLLPARPRERMEADWLRLALAACGRRGPTPPRSFSLHVKQPRQEIVLRVLGGPDGTAVTDGPGPAETTVAGDVRTVLDLVGGALSPATAVREGRVKIGGEAAAFDVDSGGARGDDRSRQSSPSSIRCIVSSSSPK